MVNPPVEERHISSEEHREAQLLVWRAALEAAAKLAEGEIYKEHYRTWPWYGEGNKIRDSGRVKFCLSLAAKIRSLKQ